MGGSGDMAAVTRVRLATADDAAACAAIYAPYVAETAISFEIVPPTADEMAGRIAKVMAHWPWVVVEVDGVVRGYAYATRHRERPAYDWTTETTVYVHREFHGQGLGRAAMRGLVAVLGYRDEHVDDLPRHVRLAAVLQDAGVEVGQVEADETLEASRLVAKGLVRPGLHAVAPPDREPVEQLGCALRAPDRSRRLGGGRPLGAHRGDLCADDGVEQARLAEPVEQYANESR